MSKRGTAISLVAGALALVFAQTTAFAITPEVTNSDDSTDMRPNPGHGIPGKGSQSGKAEQKASQKGIVRASQKGFQKGILATKAEQKGLQKGAEISRQKGGQAGKAEQKRAFANQKGLSNQKGTLGGKAEQKGAERASQKGVFANQKGGQKGLANQKGVERATQKGGQKGNQKGTLASQKGIIGKANQKGY